MILLLPNENERQLKELNLLDGVVAWEVLVAVVGGMGAELSSAVVEEVLATILVGVFVGSVIEGDVERARSSSSALISFLTLLVWGVGLASGGGGLASSSNKNKESAL